MMGMTLGLDKPGQCTQANLAKARSLVPRALEPYVVDIFNGVGRGDEASATNGGIISANTGTKLGKQTGSSTVLADSLCTMVQKSLILGHQELQYPTSLGASERMRERSGARKQRERCGTG